MTRIPLLSSAAATGDAAKALASANGHMNVFRVLAHAQGCVLPQMRLGGAILRDQALDHRRRELLVLMAMALEGGAYEWAQHVEIGVAVGVTHPQVEALERLDLASDIFSAADRAVLAFGRQVVERVRVEDAVFAAARPHLSDQEMVEAILAIGFYMTLARLTEALEVEQDPVQGLRVFDAAGRS